MRQDRDLSFPEASTDFHLSSVPATWQAPTFYEPACCHVVSDGTVGLLCSDRPKSLREQEHHYSVMR